MASTKAEQTSADLATAQPPFVVSDDVEQVALGVISRNDAFRSLDEISLIYLLRNDKGVEDDDSIDSIVKAVKAPPLWRHLTGYDVAIWVKSAYWKLFDATQRDALMTHALCHVYIDDESGKVKMLGHDVEEFHRVAMQFGGWTGSVAKFAKAIEAQRTHAQGEQQALDTALASLDGTEIVDEQSGTVARISTSKRDEHPDPDATLTGDPAVDLADVPGVSLDEQMAAIKADPGADEPPGQIDPDPPAAPKRPRRSKS